jgi:hypothetical protein
MNVYISGGFFFLRELTFSTLYRLTIAMWLRPSWNLSSIPNKGSLFGTNGTLLRGILRRGVASKVHFEC